MDAVREIPVRLGRYEIVERLAAGGMGEVFVARSFGAGGFIKPVALKRIHPHLADNIAFIHMLHDEARLAASIRHPNIVATIDVGAEGKDHFVVLDFVSGDPLSRILRELKKRKGAMPPWVTAWVGAQIASALHAAHEAKNLAGEPMEIVHRDVSLANIMLSDAGHPMLFDFGVAKAKQRVVETSHGELKGKLAYMAPETFHGAAVDRTVDIYSLGVVLYELLTGKSPYQRGSDTETIAALQRADAPPPSELRREVDGPFDEIVLRAIARERAHRYANAVELEQALRGWAREAGAPHDADAVASWLAKNFPQRLEARAAMLARVAHPGEVTVIDTLLSTPEGGTPVSGPISVAGGAARHLPTPLSGPISNPALGGTPISLHGVHLLQPAGAMSTPPCSEAPPSTTAGMSRPITGARITGFDFDVPPRRRPWLALAGATAGAVAGVIGMLLLVGAHPAPGEDAGAAPAAAPAATDLPAPAEPTAEPSAAPQASATASAAAEPTAAPTATTRAAPRAPVKPAAAPKSKPTGKTKGPLVREYE
jgi:serine/threonine-protein kinase